MMAIYLQRGVFFLFVCFFYSFLLNLSLLMIMRFLYREEYSFNIYQDVVDHVCLSRKLYSVLILVY